MSADSVMPAQAAYKDRRTGCIVFGVLEILLGVACLLFTLLAFVAASLPGTEIDMRSLVFSVSFYGLMAVGFVWLGVGSILCRRWARTLLLILAWSWLVAGATSIAMLAVLLPAVLGRGSDEPVILVVAIVVVAAVAFFFVVLPTLMIVFYQGRNVQATFEAIDPKRRWTDACPVPVLTTALWLAYGAVSIVLMIGLYGSVVPLFGRLLTGPTATALLLAAAAVWLWLAWAFYRLKSVALWAAIALSVVWFGSAVVTFARVDFLEIYRLLNYPEAQVNAIRELGMFSGHAMAWMMGLMGVATIAFLVWLRRYFPRTGSEAIAP